MSNEDIVDSVKTFSGKTANQSQIRLIPAQKNNIKAFTQWVKYQVRLGTDPTTLPFPQADTSELLRGYNTHQLFVSKSYTIYKAENTIRSMKQDKWEGWEPTFMKYVREIPARDGVPLKYTIIHNYFANLTPNKDLLDEYVDKASLQGESFTIDSSEVHTFIVNLISHNE